MNYSLVFFEIMTNHPDLKELVDNRISPVTIPSDWEDPSISFVKTIVPMNMDETLDRVESIKLEVFALAHDPDDAQVLATNIREAFYRARNAIIEDVLIAKAEFVIQESEFYIELEGEDRKGKVVIPLRFDLILSQQLNYILVQDSM